MSNTSNSSAAGNCGFFFPSSSAPLGIRRVEKPRPLRSVSQSQNSQNRISAADLSSVEDVISLLENVAHQLTNANYERPVIAAIVSLNAALKIHGSRLEVFYKDQLDKLQVHLRNACRDGRLDLVARLHLLEIIELRAMNWVINDNVTNYYEQELSQIEYDFTDMALTSKQRPLSLNANAADFQPSVTNNLLAQLAGVIPQGEVLVPSGKFPRPSQPPGKAYYKDEVVIRNADSGKVVAGAKERLVQITGQTEQSVCQATSLIEETIRRNMSPSPGGETFEKDVALKGPGRRTSDELPNDYSVSEMPLLRSNSECYKYTINVGGDCIKIYGSNAVLVRTAKIVLDDYFGEHRLTQTTDNIVKDDGQQQSIIRVLRQPLLPTATKEVIAKAEEADARGKERRANFAKTTLAKQEVQRERDNMIYDEPEMGNKGLTVYERDFLLECADDPSSWKEPANWPVIVQQFPMLSRQVSSGAGWRKSEALKRSLPFGFVKSINNNSITQTQFDPLRPDFEPKIWDDTSGQWIEQQTRA